MPRQTNGYRSIVITGASSGIGAALAIEYASPGVRLVITGRDEARLETTAITCRQKGAEVAVHCLDVMDGDAMASILQAEDWLSPIDLVIANAGISAGMSGELEKNAQARTIFRTNIEGVTNTLLPILPRMVERGNGQAAILSSMAAFVAWPGAPAYCASKVAVRFYGEALAAWMRPHNVGVSVIHPGFVRSAMTAVNEFPMPMMIEADAAAKKIRKALAKKKRRIVFPLPLYIATRFFNCWPFAMQALLWRRIPAKPGL